MRRPLGSALLVVAALAVLAGCSGSDDATAGTTIDVSSTAKACELSATTAKAGTVAFAVTNDGSAETEFYVKSKDGKKIIGEVEDIGPGVTRTLKATLDEGTYTTSCKPGMKGAGISAPFTVTAA